jgi:hypothetical protein
MDIIYGKAMKRRVHCRLLNREPRKAEKGRETKCLPSKEGLWKWWKMVLELRTEERS